MNIGYGPALLLGIIIGGAIIADDFVRPHPPHRQKGPHALLPLPGPAGGDHKVWIMKGDGAENPEVRKEMHVVLEDERSDSDQERVMVMVAVKDHSPGDEMPGPELAEKIREVVDGARAEGREPTEAEIEAAIAEITGDATNVEIDIDIQSD